MHRARWEIRAVKSKGLGVCHVCDEKELKPVEFCSMCGHYFCEDCKTLRSFKNVWNRGLEAVKELVGGKKDDCCWLVEEAS
jgi:hypothetical protein